jgi:carbonic anhydrase
MELARPLPPFLVDRHRRWRAAMPESDRSRLAGLAEAGQHPQAMIIACCDSRVMASDVFGAAAGEFFVHRNIANLVPPFQPDGQQHGTSATIEFAVTVLKVAHLIVMGHFGCGGVQGCHDMLSGRAPELTEPTSFVGSWLRVLTPGFETVEKLGLAPQERLVALEKQAVLISLQNLMTFPFVADAIAAGRLEIHGVWKDIRDGGLEVYDAASGSFQRI